MKRNMKIWIISSIILAIIVAVGIFVSMIHNDKLILKEEIVQTGIFLEFGESKLEISLGDLIAENSDEKFYDKATIDTSQIDYKKVGEYNLIVNYKKQSKMIKVHIKDTIPPVIKFKKAEPKLRVLLKKEISQEAMLEEFTVTDKSEASKEIVGTYDKNKVGKYKLKAKSTDESGNTSEKEFIIEVYSDPGLAGVPEDTGNILIYLSKKEGRLARSYVPKNLVNLGKYGRGSVKDIVLEAYKGLYEDAKKAGIDYYIVSAYRGYELQEELFEHYTKTKGLEWAEKSSARPGTSEHQTGLTMDVTTGNLGFTLNQAMGDMKEGIWLAENAHRYGFIIRYPKGKTDITGFKYEPWHLRYLGIDVATEIYEKDITFDEYVKL